MGITIRKDMMDLPMMTPKTSTRSVRMRRIGKSTHQFPVVSKDPKANKQQRQTRDITKYIFLLNCKCSIAAEQILMDSSITSFLASF